MPNDPFSSLERSAQDTQAWLHAIGREMSHPSPKVAYHALRGVLAALRDHLPVDEAHHLAAQLPVLVRGLYFEGYRPAGKPDKLDRAAFLARVAGELDAAGGASPEAAAHAVLRVLDAHLGDGALAHTMAVLPEELRRFYPAASSGPTPADLSPTRAPAQDRSLP
jgi:uncharacterized protein (DUF2267 family)